MKIKFTFKNLSSLISHFSFQKGFTLIELLIVIAILGVLAAGILVAINPIKKINQAKDATLKSNMTSIINALQASLTQGGGVYPATLAALAPSEIKTVPKQPNGSDYGYAVNADKAAVWGSYSDTTVGIYHCWDSTGFVLKISATAPTNASPTCPP